MKFPHSLPHQIEGLYPDPGELVLFSDFNYQSRTSNGKTYGNLCISVYDKEISAHNFDPELELNDKEPFDYWFEEGISEGIVFDQSLEASEVINNACFALFLPPGNYLAKITIGEMIDYEWAFVIQSQQER